LETEFFFSKFTRYRPIVVNFLGSGVPSDRQKSAAHFVVAVLESVGLKDEPVSEPAKMANEQTFYTSTVSKIWNA
jgi:hypothetical protein